jgi:hypothetical protein
MMGHQQAKLSVAVSAPGRQLRHVFLLGALSCWPTVHADDAAAGQIMSDKCGAGASSRYKTARRGVPDGFALGGFLDSRGTTVEREDAIGLMSLQRNSLIKIKDQP